MRRLLQRGIRLLKFHGPHALLAPDAYLRDKPALAKVYALAEERGVPVMFHMGGVFDPGGSLEWGNPLLLDKVGRRFPTLKIIVAHLGQPMMGETISLMRKNKNVYTDLSARFHRKWQLYNGLQVAIEYKVTDRLLFGSDFPVMTTQASIDAFRSINDWGEGVTLPRIPEQLIDDIGLPDDDLRHLLANLVARGS